MGEDQPSSWIPCFDLVVLVVVAPIRGQREPLGIVFHLVKVLLSDLMSCRDERPRCDGPPPA